MASQSQSKPSWLLIFLLILLALGVLIFALPSFNTRVTTTTQTASQGQCLPNGQGFDEQQEAFTLAQVAEQHRIAHSFGGNYGFGSYTLCYQDGTQQRFQSPAARGYGDEDSNDTHSEQGVYKWLEMQLSGLSIDQSKVTAIYVIIFSQVRVCIPCRRDMMPWQRGLRQAAKTNNLFLSIWDIRFGSKSAFIPATYPAGSGTPVAIEDVRKVPINFIP